MQNMNIEHADCLRSTTQFWETIVTNICSGETTAVPLGFWEMSFLIGAFALFLGVGLMFVVMASDFFRGW